MLGNAKAAVVRHGRQVVRRAGLELVGAEIAMQRRVERVEPDDRLVAAVHVLVPGPARRDDEVAFLHRAVLAVDDGGGAVAFDHEAQRIHGVAVRPRLLAGQQDLQRGRRDWWWCCRRRRAASGSVKVSTRRSTAAGLATFMASSISGRTSFHLQWCGGRAALAGLVRELALPQRREVRGLPVLADLLVGPAAGRGRDRRVRLHSCWFLQGRLAPL